MQTDITKLLEISAKRGITFTVVDAGLRVFGPPTAVNLLRTHFAANEAAIIKAVAANPCGLAGNQVANQAGNQTQQIHGGQGGLVGQAACPQFTPLAILSRLTTARQHQPTAAEIDLALWLTQVATEVAADPDPGTVWPVTISHGDKTAPQVQPIRVADTVAGLVRGPRADTRPAETTASWLERIRQFRQAVESARQWRSAEYQVRDWPAELRREPKPVVAPRPMVSTSPLAATRATTDLATAAPK